MICLRSALAIISIFPNQPDPAWACYVPWWNILHFLVQSTAVLLINISLNCSSLEKQRGQSFIGVTGADQLLESSEVVHSEAICTAVKKALQWLYCFAETDGSARRAFELCNSCACRILPNGCDLDKIASINAASQMPYLDVPTDDTHQQYRSRFGVPYPQFVGTEAFSYDHSIGTDLQSSDLRATEVFDDVTEQQSFGILGADVDMSSYIPDPECATVNSILGSLAGINGNAN